MGTRGFPLRCAGVRSAATPWDRSAPGVSVGGTTMSDKPTTNGIANGTPNGHSTEPLPSSATQGQGPGNGPRLTTRQGHPVHDNQSNRTVGDRGPTLLENYH